MSRKTGRAEISCTKEEMYEMYVVRKMTQKEIGEIYGCTPTTIHNKMSELGIPTRSVREAKNLIVRRKLLRLSREAGNE